MKKTQDFYCNHPKINKNVKITLEDKPLHGGINIAPIDIAFVLRECNFNNLCGESLKSSDRCPARKLN